MAADAAKDPKLAGMTFAIGGACVIVVLLGIAYVAAPKVVAGIFVHALGVVAQLWPGAR